MQEDKNKKIEFLELQVKRLQKENLLLSNMLRQKEKDLEMLEADNKAFGEDIDAFLDLALDLERKNIAYRDSQTYMQNINFYDKELIFGINIDKGFIEDSSFANLKYFLFNLECFTFESIELSNLRAKSKKDLVILGETLSSFIVLECLQKGVQARGVIEILQNNLTKGYELKYYGNIQIGEIVDDFLQKMQKM